MSTGGDSREPAVLADAGLAVVDPRVTVDVAVGTETEREPVEAVDVAAATSARGLRAVDGDLAGLAAGGVAVTEGWHLDHGTDLGDRLPLRVEGRELRPAVVAVVRDAPDLYADVIAPRELVLPGSVAPVPDLVFVDPGGRDLVALLAGTRARVQTASAWIDDVDRQTRAANNLGLWVLLGPAGLYAAIAIVNSVLVGASQRREQLHTIRLLGATPVQLRRMSLWEAGSVGGAALLTGASVTVLVGWLIRTATSRDVSDQALTVPWLPLAAIAAACVGLTLVAAVAGSRSAARA